MRTRLEAAVAQEILAEVKDQGRTLKWVQERSGVKARAWGYYFKGDRPIPFQVLADVCTVLGLKTSEVIARAEADIAEADQLDAQPLDPPRVNVAKILADSPHLAGVREEGQRRMREARAAE